jgi:phage gp46-like protein
MPEYLIRADEGCLPDPFLLPDSVHVDIEGGTDFVCDWALAKPPNDTLNVGGLQATNELGTAVYLLLFSDVFCPPDHPLAFLADGDNRGWWGDGVDVRADLDEKPLGSLLWLLERAPLVVAGTPIEQWAETFAAEALSVLQMQGAVAEIDCSAVANTIAERVDLSVELYGSDGSVVFSNQFELAWRQIATAPQPLL